MKRITKTVIVAALALLASTAQAGEKVAMQSAAEWVKLAESQLASGDFSASLESYAEAVKADPKSEELKQQYTLLRQVIRVRRMHAVEEDPKKKLKMASALRSFYYDHALYKEALTLDQQTYSDVQSAVSASNLSESHLELDQNGKVISLLSTLPQEQQSMRTHTLLAIALLREDNREDTAVQAARGNKPPEDDPVLCFDLARMYSLLGEVDQSSQMLTRSFQSTLPSQLDIAHARALKHADLELLRHSDLMSQALATKSKVAESACSSKSSCAGCPSASKCSSEGAQDDPSHNDKKK